MDTTITLNRISAPPSTKVQIYKNGDDTYKIIIKNAELNINENTTAMGTLTVYRVQGITILNNFDEMMWEDIVASDGKLYCLPNKEGKGKIYDVTINSIMN